MGLVSSESDEDARRSTPAWADGPNAPQAGSAALDKKKDKYVFFDSEDEADQAELLEQQQQQQLGKQQANLGLSRRRTSSSFFDSDED